MRKAVLATALGPDARVEGDLLLTGSAVVAGEVTGDVRCGGTLELTATARVGGGVRAEALRLAGRVNGGVEVAGSTALLRGAVLGGVLTTGRLEVEPGAAFEGRLVLRGDGDAAAEAEAEVVSEDEVPGPLAMPHGAGEAGGFAAVPGAGRAAMRPRRRVPLPPVG
ncbi:MAG: polymer-forming cytoskeletal protein [Planctomycetota bacterium]